ncbi:MAG: alginate export family protein [Candidatus Omnitrophota bacterium]|nr:alginate export family protein [Candidatus Omnitrophota bacterium]
MKLFKVLCVVALMLAVSTAAFAETQSVKVSGDITMRGLARGNYDLDSNDIKATTESSDWATYLTSTAEVQVDADLTDNVAGVIRLVNQRVWGDDNYTSTAAGELRRIDPNGTVTTAAIAPANAAFDVDVDLAYIELKEFLYSPLTLKIGKQDLWFGKGFIIGAQPQDNQNSLYAGEYTVVNSFDAIRATLDYDPWTIDAIYSKIAENARRADDDINLWGVNVGYVFDSYDAEAEAYWFWKESRNPGGAAGISLNSLNGNINNDVHVFGARGSFDPIEDWTVALEGAYQGGEYMVAGQIGDRERRGWAVDALIECRYWQDDFAWKPVLSAEYIYYSGEEYLGDQTAASNGRYDAWDPMFRGKFDTAIREFQNVFYSTAQASTPSYTNQHQALLRGTIEPTDSLTIDATYGHFWLAKKFNAAVNTDKEIGDEVDLKLTWDYTEDVQFGLLAGWFFPGDHFASNQDDIATDVVGTVSLSF